jgi:lysozyme
MPKLFSRLRLALVAALTLAAAGCSIDPLDRYPHKSDARPHPGVAKAKYKPIHGIDVSKWQGEIDWQAVRKAGTRFVFIKATEGGDHLDERFYANWNGARSAGIAHAAYHFVFWCRPAHEQAEWFVKHIPNDPLALPPVLDVEWNGHSRTCPKKVPREVAHEKIRVMLAELERHTGKRPIIYTDITFHKDVFEGTTEFNDYPFWIRSVAAEPQERYQDRPWTFWQYTTTGRVLGVRGDVDRNAFYGSESEWKAFVRTGCDPRLAGRLAARGLCREPAGS